MDEPDEVTALIATVINDCRTPDDPEGMARAVRDALAEAGLVRTDAYPVTTHNVLSAEPLRRMLVNTVEQMTLAQRERWELTGYYRARTEMMKEPGS